MKMPLVRAALVAAATVVLIPVAASAASLSIDDATGDTFLVKYDETTDTSSYEPAGSQVNVDLDRVVVRHTDRTVTATATYAALRRGGNQFLYMLRLRTDEGLRRDVTVETLFSGWAGAVDLSRPNGDPVRCPGLDLAIDYTADTVTVRVPRSCLSRPRYVEAFTVAAGFSDAGDQYVDHGHLAGMKEKVVWSDRIRRG